MKCLIQIVKHASVEIVDTETTNSIATGLLIYVGISKNDLTTYPEKIEKFVRKISTTKFFFNPQTDKIDQSLEDIHGEILLISNFTLYGDMRKGTKLDFSDSANFSEAKPIYDELVRKLQEKGIRLQTGEFGAMMKVSSLNDGPINIIWEE